MIFNVFLEFQCTRIVFLPVVKATSKGFEFRIGGFLTERCSSRQRDGDSGMLQLMI